MQFVALARRVTEKFSDEDFAPLLAPEAERARALYAAGTFRSLHSRGDIPGAVIIMEAENLDDARAACDSLPLVKLGMLEVQIVPLRPYRGFVGG